MSELATQPKTLIKKLAEVMKAVSSVPKRGHNSFHHYDYATEADIVAALRIELADRHVMILPAVTARSRENVGDKGSVLTHLEMEFTFIDGESGETLTRPWLGAGTDKEDKGAYKAMTGGEKYFLLKTFLIPTGDDPEAEKPHDRSNSKPRQQSRREVATKDGARVDAETGEQVSSKPKSSAGDFISAKQQAELIKAGHKAGWSASDFASWLKAQGYGEWAKIPAADYKSAMTVMESGAEPVGGIQ
jgi:hypothetical protein